MNRIKELRLSHKWRQVDLAERLRIAKTVVSRYENEQLDLSTETIRALCAVFDVTADYLLCISDTPAPVVTEEDARLLQAYHAAPDNVKAAINALLLTPETASEAHAV